MNFDMTKPCDNCPFRTDIRPFLRRDRAREIVESGQTFQCHKTVDYNGESEEPNPHTKNAQHCAGLLILLEHEDRPHQMMRIAERIGLYDRRKLDMTAPVHRSAAAFVKAQEK